MEIVNTHMTNTMLDMLKFPQLEVETKEQLDTDLGIYTREIFIPKDSVMIGEVHKVGCVNIITKGKILVKTSLTDPGILYTVPYDRTITFVTKPGSQKIVYAQEDTVFVNVFVDVKSKNIQDLEEELIQPNTEVNKMKQILKTQKQLESN